MADGPGLTASTTTGHVDSDVDGFGHFEGVQRTQGQLSLMIGGTIIRQFPLVDGEGTGTFGNAYAGSAGLATTRGDIDFAIGFGAHVMED